MMDNNEIETCNNKKSTNNDTNSNYSLAGFIKESSAPLYGISIHMPGLVDPRLIVFATTGANRVNFYEFNCVTDTTSFITGYVDADLTEVYYVCDWTNDKETNAEICVFAGLKGIIKIIQPFRPDIKRPFLFGHGSAINDLRFHPIFKHVLLSSSKDNSLRLWNINTSVCIAILGGADGHRDEVLSADFNFSGTLIMSSGIDHSLKMWNISKDNVRAAIEKSDKFKQVNIKSFKTELINFPDFATRDVHYNYIDCVRWHNNLILSKSIENKIIQWKPGQLNENIYSISRSNKNISILHKFQIKNAEVWFVRFCLDYSQKYLALGNESGKVYIWDLHDVCNYTKTVIAHPDSKCTIRSVALSRSGRVLIAVNDEGQIFIWKKKLNTNK